MGPLAIFPISPEKKYVPSPYKTTSGHKTQGITHYAPNTSALCYTRSLWWPFIPEVTPKSLACAVHDVLKEIADLARNFPGLCAPQRLCTFRVVWILRWHCLSTTSNAPYPKSHFLPRPIKSLHRLHFIKSSPAHPIPTARTTCRGWPTRWGCARAAPNAPSNAAAPAGLSTQRPGRSKRPSRWVLLE